MILWQFPLNNDGVRVVVGKLSVRRVLLYPVKKQRDGVEDLTLIWWMEFFVNIRLQCDDKMRK